MLILFTCFTRLSLENEIHNIFNSPANYYDNEGKEYLTLRFVDLKKEEPEAILFELSEFAKSNHLTLMASQQSESGLITKHIKYLFTSDQEVLRKLYFTDDFMINFANPTQEYYSNDLSDLKAVNHLDYLDKKKLQFKNKDIIEIHQFSKALEDFQNNTFIGVGLYCEDPDQVLDLLKNSSLNQYLHINSVSDLNDSNVTKSQMNPDEQEIDLSNFVMVTISFALFLLLIFNYVSHRKKEISIQRLMGISSIHIANRLFIRTFLINLLLYFICQIGMFLYLCGMPRPVNHELREMLFLYLILYMFILVLSYLISLVFIKKCNVVKGMKQNKLNTSIIPVNLILKACITIVIISPFIEMQSYIASNIVNMSSLFARQDELKQYAHVSNIKGSDGLETNMKKIYDILNQYGALYCDIDVYNSALHNLEYSESDEKGVIYPFIFVNKNYLEKVELFDVNHNKINLDDYQEETVVYFIPEAAENLDLQDIDFLYHMDEPIVMIKNPGEINSLLPMYFTNEQISLHDPIIVCYIENLDIQINQFNFYIDMTNRDTYSSLMRDLTLNGLDGIVDFEKNEIQLEAVISNFKARLLTFLLVVIVYFIMYISFLYLTVTMYFNEYKQLLALKYLNGTSYFKRYGNLFVLNSCVYLVPFMISITWLGLTWQSVIGYMLLFILLEVMMEIYMIQKFQKHGIVTVLKGE